MLQFHRRGRTIQQPVAFKRHLADQVNTRSGEVLSKATLHSNLSALHNFFRWVAGRPGFKSRISYSDADYFRLSEKDARIAKSDRDKPVPTVAQIEHVLSLMPIAKVLQRRDRAVIAFILLTGARDGAAASMKLKHIDLPGGASSMMPARSRRSFRRASLPGSSR